MKLVHWRLAVDGWAVTFGTARRGLGSAAAHPGLSSHSPPINGQCTSTVLLYNGPLLCGFNVAIKGLRVEEQWRSDQAIQFAKWQHPAVGAARFVCLAPVAYLASSRAELTGSWCTSLEPLKFSSALLLHSPNLPIIKRHHLPITLHQNLILLFLYRLFQLLPPRTNIPNFVAVVYNNYGNSNFWQKWHFYTIGFVIVSRIERC